MQYRQTFLCLRCPALVVSTLEMKAAITFLLISQQQQQQPSLIPLSGVGYMDQMTP
jgi:hypothetical protein